MGRGLTGDRDRFGFLDGQALADLEDWRSSIYLRWMNSRMELSDFASVPAIIEAGLARYPSDERLLNSVAYLGQEWSGTLPDFGVAMGMLSDLSGRFPTSASALSDVATGYVWRRIEGLVAAGQFSTAIAMVDVLAQTILTEDQRTEAGVFAYDLIARGLMQNGQWQEAGRTYADGIARYPSENLLVGNSKYFAQQWQAAAREESGLDGISAVTKELVALFPDMEDISKSGEQEIRRVVYERTEESSYEDALEYLSGAGPFLSEDTLLNLQEFIFDNWAKHLIGNGEWESAATIYVRSLEQAPQSKLLVGNTDYLIQEWASARTVEGEADALIRTTQKMARIFEGVRPYEDVVANVAALHAQNKTKAGEFESALAFANDVASLLGLQLANQVREAIYDNWAKSLMADEHWHEAGARYIWGRETLPESGLLKQNMAYLVQEWARAEYATRSADGLVDVAKIVSAEFADFPDAQDVVSTVASNAAAERIRGGDFEEGLRLAEQTKQLMSDETFTDIVVFSYDSWARTYFERDWAKAAEIYTVGLARLPDNSTFIQNRDYSLSKLK